MKLRERFPRAKLFPMFQTTALGSAGAGTLCNLAMKAREASREERDYGEPAVSADRGDSANPGMTEEEVFRGQVQPSIKEVALVQDICTGASLPCLLSSSQAEPLQPSLVANGEGKRRGAGMPWLTPGDKRRAKEPGRTCWQGGQSCSKPTCSCPAGV